MLGYDRFRKDCEGSTCGEKCRGVIKDRIHTSKATIRIVAGLWLYLSSAYFQRAYGHVKWFAPYNLEQPPLRIDLILTKEYIHFFLASVAFIYAFFLMDRYLYRRRFLASALEKSVSPRWSLLYLRAAIFVFFSSLFVFGLAKRPFLLTPELAVDYTFVPWLQFTLALCALSRYTTPLVGVGIVILYGISVTEYGVFHVLDYLIFLGVAYYLGASLARGERWIISRYLVLFTATGLTLLWASVEKWGYPHWTYPLLKQDPSLLMGMYPYTYMVLAGFVEFNVTFILLGSVSVVSRAIALGLCAIFVMAICKFGLLDAVGHLLIITILVIMAIRGPTKARCFLVLSDKSLWTEAYFMTSCYLAAFVMVFLAYYGLYHMTNAPVSIG